MVIVWLELDDSAQQALHFIEQTQLFSQHGLLVEQVGVVGCFYQRLRQHVIGLAVLLEFPE